MKMTSYILSIIGIFFLSSCKKEAIRLDGCYSYSAPHDTIPSGSWLIEWWINTEGLANYYSDTITLEENEFKVYEIDY